MNCNVKLDKALEICDKYKLFKEKLDNIHRKDVLENFKTVSLKFEKKVESYRDLVHIKALIDQWNLVSSGIVLHPNKKQFFIDHSNKYFYQSTVGDQIYDAIWGMIILYTESLPEDEGLMFSTEIPPCDKSVVSFKI